MMNGSTYLTTNGGANPTTNCDASLTTSCDVSLTTSCGVSLTTSCDVSLTTSCDVSPTTSCGVSLTTSCDASLTMSCGVSPTTSCDVSLSCDDVKMMKNVNDPNCGIRRYFVSSSLINTPFTKYLYFGLFATQVLSVTILSSDVSLISLELNKSNLGFSMLYWKLSSCSVSLKS